MVPQCIRFPKGKLPFEVSWNANEGLFFFLDKKLVCVICQAERSNSSLLFERVPPTEQSSIILNLGLSIEGHHAKSKTWELSALNSLCSSNAPGDTVSLGLALQPQPCLCHCGCHFACSKCFTRLSLGTQNTCFWWNRKDIVTLSQKHPSCFPNRARSHWWHSQARKSTRPMSILVIIISSGP